MTVTTMEKPRVTHDIVWVTSEMAGEWLERHQGPNRAINEARVLLYQSDMEAGRWRFDAAPIRFSHDGHLLDGQHRLTALAAVAPSMELPFLVVQGLDSDTQMVMDQPQVRTVGQNLALRGVPNASTVAASVKLFLDWTRGRLFKSSGRAGTTKAEAEEWALDHLDVIESLFATAFRKIDAPHSVSGAFGLAIMQLAPARAFRFFDLLTSGVGLQEGDPILALDRRLRNIRRAGVKVSSREYLTYFIKAWNAWVTNTEIKKMQLGRYGVTEDTFPVLLPVRDEGRGAAWSVDSQAV